MKRTLPSSLALATVLLPAAYGQTELAAFLDPHPGATFGTEYGTSVDIDGDTMVVGAWDTSYQGKNHAGAAYVYRRVGGAWQFEAELHQPNPEIHDQFGRSVAVSGNVVVVGAPDFPISAFTGTGRAHVFRRLASGWTHEATLVPSVAAINSSAGKAVEVDGDRILVLTPGYLSLSPRVSVFEKGAGGWTETALISSPDPSSVTFGLTMVLAGDVALIGRDAEVFGGQPEVYHSIFRRNATGGWDLEAKLHVPLSATDAGQSVAAFDGARALLSAPGKNVDGVANVGRVFFFVYQGMGQWAFEQTVENPDPLHFSSFGGRLALAGDIALATLSGASASVLRREAGVWYAEPPFVPGGTVVGYVASAAISGDEAVLGNPATATPHVGAAYVYRLDPPFYLRLGKGKLVSADDALYQVRGGSPGQFVWLAASLVGEGTFPVPPLATSLDILQPFPIPPAPQTLDSLGVAQWKIPIPPGVVGLEVWMQGVFFGNATVNVRDDVIQP